MTTSFRSGRGVCLELQRAGEGDVAVKMALVKFVEEDRGDAAQVRIVNAIGGGGCLPSRSECACIRRDIFEPDLIADFVAETAIAF